MGANQRLVANLGLGMEPSPGASRKTRVFLNFDDAVAVSIVLTKI